MNKLTIHACPVCGGTHLKTALTCRDFVASGETFAIWMCETCGFAFTQDAPDEADIAPYYETPQYIPHSDTRKGLVNTLYHLARTFRLKQKAKLVEHEAHRHKGRLLDIGTGTGYFADTMRRRGWQVEAVEKNAGARDFARQRFGLDVKPETALAEWEDGAFDVVTLWHVMEHLQHLDETWRTLKRLLNDDGTLVVAVPNLTSYDAKHYGADWAAYDVPRHLWHFAPATMQRLAEKHGFVLVERRPMPLDAFYIAILTERNRKRSFAVGRGLLTGIMAGMAAGAKRDRSSSLTYVFRKQKN